MAHHSSTFDKFTPPRISDPDEEDEQLLEKAMEGVRPLEAKRTVPRKNGIRSRRSQLSKNEELHLMRDFVTGKSRFDWAFHPEYTEGGPEQENRQLVRKLRGGGFSVQAHLDLHGLTQAEALVELEEFLRNCRSQNYRCVRIIHGKGKNSANNEGVLKRKVPEWLSMRRFSRMIVAFTSAPPADGGVGATYVLLRKRPRPRSQKQ